MNGGIWKTLRGNVLKEPWPHRPVGADHQPRLGEVSRRGAGLAEHEGALDEVRLSAMAVSWSLPNMFLTREKTRSDAAEEGAIAKMMRAAFAHVGKRGLYER